MRHSSMMCATHFEINNGEGSADMGIEGVSFGPGTCAYAPGNEDATCDNSDIVFWIEA